MKTCWWLFMLACLVVVPAVQASPIAAPLSAPGFPEPLIVIGPLTAREQQDLSHFLASTPPGVPADLEAFLAAHPQSPYRLAILTDLGLAAYRPAAIQTILGYAGMFHHARSGLYLTHYRAYAPHLGRWLSRDPLG